MSAKSKRWLSISLIVWNFVVIIKHVPECSLMNIVCLPFMIKGGIKFLADPGILKARQIYMQGLLRPAAE